METPRTDQSLPTVLFDRLWHVGTLDPAHKRSGSLEGACVSVSRCPAAWREISDGHVTGDCWVADASSVELLDAHGLDDGRRAAVLAWGVAEGLCEPVSLWRVEWWDDELDQPVTMLLPDRRQALEESRDHNDDDESVVEVREHRSTLLLETTSLSGQPLLGDDLVHDMLLPLWTWANTDLAGVWWDDRFDPIRYSAPRGGILPARLDRLHFVRTEHEPYDESDASEDEED